MNFADADWGPLLSGPLNTTEVCQAVRTVNGSLQKTGKSRGQTTERQRERSPREERSRDRSQSSSKRPYGQDSNKQTQKRIAIETNEQRHNTAGANCSARSTAHKHWVSVPSWEVIKTISEKEKRQLLTDFPKTFIMTGTNFSGLNMVPRDGYDVQPFVCQNCEKPNCRRNTCPAPVVKFCHNCGRRGVTVATCIRCRDAYVIRCREQALSNLQRDKNHRDLRQVPLASPSSSAQRP